VDSPDVKVLWDFNIFTNHHLTAQHPDVEVIDKQTKTAQIIDVAVPADNNVSTKEKEKIDKHKELCVELLSLWRVHCEVIPTSYWWAGLNTNMLQGYLQRLKISPFCTVELLQQTAVSGSSYILRRYL